MRRRRTRPVSCMYVLGLLCVSKVGTPANTLRASCRDSASKRMRPPDNAKLLQQEDRAISEFCPQL